MTCSSDFLVCVQNGKVIVSELRKPPTDEKETAGIDMSTRAAKWLLCDGSKEVENRKRFEVDVLIVITNSFVHFINES